MEEEKKNNFNCELCKYIAVDQSYYNRHLETKNNKRNIEIKNLENLPIIRRKIKLYP